MSASQLRFRRRPRLRRRAVLLVWTVLLLYPNPLMLLRSARHAWSPPVAPEAVITLAATLPDDPRFIERYVTGELVRYSVPWQSHGVPWYFPSVHEVLERGSGDCQAQAIVLASLLRAKGIPARLVGSFDHLWVEYPDKQANRLENTAVTLATQNDDGAYTFRWPEINWRETWEIERAYFWDPMPRGRWWLLLAGWSIILAAPTFVRVVGGSAYRRAQAGTGKPHRYPLIIRVAMGLVRAIRI